MKRIFFAIVTACLCLSATADVVIRGTINPEIGDRISLYAITPLADSLCATAQADAAGKFVLKAALPHDGLYMLSGKDNVKHAIYLKNGERIAVKYTHERLNVLGGLSPEGQRFAVWSNKSASVLLHAYLFNYIPGGQTVAPTVFVRELNALKQTAATLKQQLKGNGAAVTLLRQKIDTDLAFCSLSYRQNHMADVDQNFISPAGLDTYRRLFAHADLLRLPYAGEMLVAYVDYLTEQQDIAPTDYAARQSLLARQSLREAYLYQVASRLRYYEKYEVLRRSVDKNPLSDALIQAFRPIEERLSWSKPGSMAIDFGGVCPDGSSLKLSQLRGKVVVVDVWATWCVPCIRMIPYFKQLEKDLANPDVTFLSVCVGTWAESGRWKKLIQEHQLEGNLIFIDSWTKGFAVDYHVTGVPRFMIIDREGRMVSFAAPAPKYPELKTMILEALGHPAAS